MKITVISKTPSYRRAGIEFTQKPRTLKVCEQPAFADEISPEDYHVLLEDSNLCVVEGDSNKTTALQEGLNKLTAENASLKARIAQLEQAQSAAAQTPATKKANKE